MENVLPENVKTGTDFCPPLKYCAYSSNGQAQEQDEIEDFSYLSSFYMVSLRAFERAATL